MHGEAALGRADVGCAVVPVSAPSPHRPGVWKTLASRAGALAANEERT